MFESLDDGKPSVTRKSALRAYGTVCAIALLGVGTYTYKCSHQLRPELRIYADLIAYAIAVVIAAWRFLKTWESELPTLTESNFYVWCIYALLWLPSLIHDLLM